MAVFEDKFMEVQADMVSLALEYVNGNAEKVFIYGVCTSLYSFKALYKINGQYVDINFVNDALSDDQQIKDDNHRLLLQVSKLGISDLQRLKKVCEEYGKEAPKELWLIYNHETKSLESKYEYDDRYQDINVNPYDEAEKWLQEIKENQL
ncbi:hypothetical protein [Streptococcus marimammalium]|uniref:hypothetical protein n=1 Tax=Streptococcus marimammalium TaxID=269666 RepID=UPI000378054E|nr:hypothetical protein [Streptococcus marimammalium]